MGSLDQGSARTGPGGRCSPIQERWYKVRALAGVSASPFTLTADWTWTGQVDPDALAGSVTALALRQWSLRTAFVRTNDQLAQLVLDPESVAPLTLYDLRAASDVADRVRAIAADLYCGPLEIERGVAFRAGLITLSADHHRVILSIDHMVADGGSLVILQRELLAIYRALQTGQAHALPVLKHQYVDWAESQWRLVAGDFGAKLRDYWASRLDDAPDLELPTDAATTDPVGPADHVTGTIAADVMARIDSLRVPIDASDALSRQEELLAIGNRRPIALLSILFTFLHRVTGQTTLCVVMPSSARPAEYSDVIGHFVVPLLVRVDIADGTTFRGLYARVRASFINAGRWRDAPLYSVYQPRPMQYRVAFNYERQEPVNPTSSIELTKTQARFPRQEYTDLDLRVHVADGRHSTHIHMVSRQARFRRDTVEQWSRELTILADQLLLRPDDPLARASSTSLKP